jgi:hypothetical protein
MEIEIDLDQSAAQRLFATTAAAWAGELMAVLKVGKAKVMSPSWRARRGSNPRAPA